MEETNIYASHGVVLEPKEITYDEQLEIHVEHFMRERMASRLEIFEQVRTRSMQPIAIDVANSHHCQTTTCFVDEDDEVMFSQVRCLRRKAWFDMRSP